MRAAQRGDDADAELARELDRRRHRLGGDDKAEAVLPVERAHHRRYAFDI